MPAHLAGQFGLGFAHLGLDQRVPGLPHQRAAAVAQDMLGQAASALHVVHDHGARIALQHIGGKQHQQAVREDVLAGAGDHAKAIAVAVEGDAEVRVQPRHHLHQRLQVVRLAGVGMVVGEGAVDLAEQRGDFGANRLQHARADHAGNAVAGIHHHLQPLPDLDVAGNAFDVVVADVAVAQRARGLGLVQAVFGDACIQVGDRGTGQGLATDHDLEAVVVRRIVAAGDRYAATGAQVIAAEIHHGRGHHADVDHVAAGLAQAGDQPKHHVGTGQAAVPAHHDVVQALVGHQRAHRLADQFGHADVEGAADHAADVVSAEDAAVDRHRQGRRARFAQLSRHAVGRFRVVALEVSQSLHRLALIGALVASKQARA